jgi:adenylate kinase family enzyme
VKRVLVTGTSGTGKSTLLAELATRGHWTVDTDYGDYFETVGGESRWIETRIDEMLSTEDPRGLLFVQGTTRNQVVFYPRFDHVVLLSAPSWPRRMTTQRRKYACCTRRPREAVNKRAVGEFARRT